MDPLARTRTHTHTHARAGLRSSNSVPRNEEADKLAKAKVQMSVVHTVGQHQWSTEGRQGQQAQSCQRARGQKTGGSASNGV